MTAATVFIALPSARRSAWALLSLQLATIGLLTWIAVVYPGLDPVVEKVLIGVWLTLVGMSVTLVLARTPIGMSAERRRCFLKFCIGLPVMQIALSYLAAQMFG
ncbi:MAG: hypothetical protein RL456_966 [Pseudomonadota bacterium]|jgi:FtsH-binding integral membrane protein